MQVTRVQKLAKEQSPIKRARFICCIAQYPPEYLVPVDETSKDDCTYMRLFAQSPRGTPAIAERAFVRGECYSLLIALALDEGVLAAKVVKGLFMHQLFYAFLRDVLVSGFVTLFFAHNNH
jgi:hypothetical protein